MLAERERERCLDEVIVIYAAITNQQLQQQQNVLLIIALFSALSPLKSCGFCFPTFYLWKTGPPNEFHFVLKIPFPKEIPSSRMPLGLMFSRYDNVFTVFVYAVCAVCKRNTLLDQTVRLSCTAISPCSPQ